MFENENQERNTSTGQPLGGAEAENSGYQTQEPGQARAGGGQWAAPPPQVGSSSWNQAEGSPYSPPDGYSNRYDAYGTREQSQPAQPPQTNQPPPGGQQPYPPYQYGSGGGWQQYNQPPEPPKYEWNFQDYDKLDNGGKKKRPRGPLIFLLCALGALGLGVVLIVAFSVVNYSTLREDGVELPDENAQVVEIPEEGAEAGEQEAPQITLYNRPKDDETLLEGGVMTIPQVAEAVLPSVVGVIKYENSQLMAAAGVGSGIIMTEDGYIITNAHVVIGGTDFKVEVFDGETYDAELVGYDTPTDLAVLKIDAQGLTAAKFGDSEQIRVGETVVAIGNPASMQLKGSVTRGIVSAVNRELDVASSYSMTYIQTDAAINPGNSGGALCNEYGQVIGINSSKIVAEGFEGIGFAIPISDAQPVLQDILSNGRVTGRVKLGITGYEVDSVDARKYGIPIGIQIASIEPGSYIAGTSAQKGDIITAIDGVDIATMLELRGILNEHEVGDVVTLTLYRPSTTTAGRGSVITVDVQLIEDAG